VSRIGQKPATLPSSSNPYDERLMQRLPLHVKIYGDGRLREWLDGVECTGFAPGSHECPLCRPGCDLPRAGVRRPWWRFWR
jgi:hypothetical protein